MDEAAWLASEDPQAMLRLLSADRYIGDRPLATTLTQHAVADSDRMLRLFACACTRLCWDRLTDPRSRKAVEVAERYADGLASEEELRGGKVVGDYTPPWAVAGHCCSPDARIAAIDSCRWTSVDHRQNPLPGIAAAQAVLLRDVCGSPFRLQEDYALCAACGLWFVPDRRRYYLCPGCGSKGPFTRSRLPHPWLTPTVVALAHAAYAEGREVPCGRCGGEGCWRYTRRSPICCSDCKGTGRASDGLLCDVRLGVLSDALEEAGCDNEDVLRHLRSPGLHCRGCWALDLIPGRD